MDIGAVVNNRYTLIARLGKGAMGTVYRAKDAQTGQEVKDTAGQGKKTGLETPKTDKK